MSEYHGKIGRVTINGVPREVVNWSAEGTIEMVDATDTGSEDQIEELKGHKDLKGTFAVSPEDIPLFGEGTDLVDLILLLDGVDRVLYVPFACVTNPGNRVSWRQMCAGKGVTWSLEPCEVNEP